MANEVGPLELERKPQEGDTRPEFWNGKKRALCVPAYVFLFKRIFFAVWGVMRPPAATAGVLRGLRGEDSRR